MKLGIECIFLFVCLLILVRRQDLSIVRSERFYYLTAECVPTVTIIHSFFSVGAAHTQCKHNWIRPSVGLFLDRREYDDLIISDLIRYGCAHTSNIWPEPGTKVRQMTSLHSSESVCCSFFADECNEMSIYFGLFNDCFCARDRAHTAIACGEVFTCTQN